MRERVRSVTVEVDGDDGGATVVLRRTGGALRAMCSCGAPGGCSHLEAALAGLSEAAALEMEGPASTSPRSTSSGPPARDLSRADPMLAELRVLIEAMLRASAGEVTTAVDEALRAATAALTLRPFPGVARVLARVSASLGARGSAMETALAITALDEVAAALEGSRGEEVRAEVTGAGAEVVRLDDLELVEVARARDRGNLVWETRVLVDPSAGAVYREEGLAGSRGLSTGLCGRRVLASLASRQVSREPARVALMQYVLEPAAPEALLRRAAESATKTLAVPEELGAAPLLGVACPRVAWLAPAAVTIERGTALLADAAGNRLAIDRARDPGAFDALAELLDGGGDIRAMAAVCHVDVDGVRVVPWSAVVERDRQMELVVLTV